MPAQQQKTSASEPRLYRIVAERIQELIRDEKIGSGERLPPERELATKLNVSRASLREALISLELTGHIEVRGGSGVYVSQKPSDTPPVQETGPGPFEVLSARRLIEPEIAAIAAKIANDSALDAILRAASEMEKMHEKDSNSANNELADRAFHVAIARAAGNSAMVGVVEYLWDQRGSLWHRLSDHFQTEQLRKETLTDHRNIVSAIAAHDAAGAKKAMRDHLERVTRVFLRG